MTAASAKACARSSSPVPASAVLPNTPDRRGSHGGDSRDPPQVVLMDLNLPDCSGAEVTAFLKANIPDLSVVVLTVYNDAGHIFKALRAGAGGVLLKQATAGEILRPSPRPTGAVRP